MSRYYIQQSLLYPSFLPSLKPFPLHLSLPSSYPQLSPTPSLSFTISSSPPSTPLFSLLYPVSPSSFLPFSALSILYSLLLPPLPLLPFSSQPTNDISAVITNQPTVEEHSQVGLNSVDENVLLYDCVSVDLSFVESLITLSTTQLEYLGVP